MRYELWRHHRLLGVFNEIELKTYLVWNMDCSIEERNRIMNMPVMEDEGFNSIQWMLTCNEWACVSPRRLNDDAFGRTT